MSLRHGLYRWTVLRTVERKKLAEVGEVCTFCCRLQRSNLHLRRCTNGLTISCAISVLCRLFLSQIFPPEEPSSRLYSSYILSRLFSPFFSVSVQMRGFFNSIQFPLIREFRYPKAKKLVINVYTDTYVGDRGGVYHRYPRDMVGTWCGASRCVCRDLFLHHRKHFLRSLALFLHVSYFGRLYFAC